MFIHYEKKSNSFLYDYAIQIRKQSELITAGLKMQYFSFDQQRLALLEVSLSTPKANIELEYDNEDGLHITVTEKKVASPCQYRRK
jgi:hypothetical protein